MVEPVGDTGTGRPEPRAKADVSRANSQAGVEQVGSCGAVWARAFCHDKAHELALGDAVV